MRLIDADEILKHEREADRMGAMLVVGKGYILNAPTIEAMPVIHSGWKEEGCYFTCQACGVYYTMYDDDGVKQVFNYCPNCGAKMDETEDKL